MMGDDDEMDGPDPGAHDIGAASALTVIARPAGWSPPAREFAPGFHGANPGPSHPEPAPRRGRRRRRSAPR